MFLTLNPNCAFSCESVCGGRVQAARSVHRRRAAVAGGDADVGVPPVRVRGAESSGAGRGMLVKKN